MDYWRECIDIAFDEAGIEASEAQREEVAGSVEGGFENYGMAHGHDVIASPVESQKDRQIANLKAEIARLEQDIDIFRSSVARRNRVSEDRVYLDRSFTDSHGKGHGSVMIEP